MWKDGEMRMKTNKYPISEYEDLEMPSDDMDTDIRKWHSHLVKVRKNTKLYCLIKFDNIYQYLIQVV